MSGDTDGCWGGMGSGGFLAFLIFAILFGNGGWGGGFNRGATGLDTGLLHGIQNNQEAMANQINTLSTNAGINRITDGLATNQAYTSANFASVNSNIDSVRTAVNAQGYENRIFDLQMALSGERQKQSETYSRLLQEQALRDSDAKFYKLECCCSKNAEAITALTAKIDYLFPPRTPTYGV